MTSGTSSTAPSSHPTLFTWLRLTRCDNRCASARCRVSAYQVCKPIPGSRYRNLRIASSSVSKSGTPTAAYWMTPALSMT
jgi:hypothetical protein